MCGPPSKKTSSLSAGDDDERGTAQSRVLEDECRLNRKGLEREGLGGKVNMVGSAC